MSPPASFGDLTRIDIDPYDVVSQLRHSDGVGGTQIAGGKDGASHTTVCRCLRSANRIAALSGRQTVGDRYPAKLVAAAVAAAVTTTKAAVTTSVTFIAAVATASGSREERPWATEDRG
jgi:hypothetical protein